MLAEMLGGLGGAALGAVSDTLSAPRRYLMQSLGLPETGGELVNHLTGLNTEDMGLAGHALNFGAEALTDPLTYGGGALARLIGKGVQGARGALRAQRAVLPAEEIAAQRASRLGPIQSSIEDWGGKARKPYNDDDVLDALFHDAEVHAGNRLPDENVSKLIPGEIADKFSAIKDTGLPPSQASIGDAAGVLPGRSALSRFLAGEEGSSAYSALKRNRERFAMIKNVIPAELERAEEMGRVFTKGGFGNPADQAMAEFGATRPQTRVTGGTGALQDQARFLAKRALQDADRSAGQYLGTPGIAATRAKVNTTPDPTSPLNGLRLSAEPMPRVVRHEGIHGMIDQAAKSGDTSGLPLMMRVPAELYRGTRGMDESLRRGLGRVTDELAAQTLQHRGLSSQLQGAQNFLLPLTEKGQQVRDIYANSFAQTSPLAAAIYKYGPPAAAMLGYYGALSGGLAASGALE